MNEVGPIANNCQNLRWRYAFMTGMTEAGLKEGKRNKQGSMEKYDHQQYRRPQMT